MAVIDIKNLPINSSRDLKTIIGFDAQNELIKAEYSNGGGVVDLTNYYTKEEIENNYYDKSVIDDYYNDYMDDYRYLNDKINNLSLDVNNIVLGVTNNITNKEWLDFISNGNRNVYYYRKETTYNNSKEYLYNLTRSIYDNNASQLTLEFDFTDRSNDVITKTYIATINVNKYSLDDVPSISMILKDNGYILELRQLIAENTARIQELESKIN